MNNELKRKRKINPGGLSQSVGKSLMVSQEWRHWWEVVVVVYVPVWLSAPATGEGDTDIAGCQNWGGREEAKGRWVGEGGSWEGGGGERKINSGCSRMRW